MATLLRLGRATLAQKDGSVVLRVGADPSPLPLLVAGQACLLGAGLVATVPNSSAAMAVFLLSFTGCLLLLFPSIALGERWALSRHLPQLRELVIEPPEPGEPGYRAGAERGSRRIVLNGRAYAPGSVREIVIGRRPALGGGQLYTAYLATADGLFRVTSTRDTEAILGFRRLLGFELGLDRAQRGLQTDEFGWTLGGCAALGAVVLLMMATMINLSTRLVMIEGDDFGARFREALLWVGVHSVFPLLAMVLCRVLGAGAGRAVEAGLR